MHKGRSRNDILLEYIEHPWFELLYWELLDKEIKKTIWRIVSPKAEDDEKQYTKVQLERMYLELVEKIKNEPKTFLLELQVNENNILNQVWTERAEKLK